MRDDERVEADGSTTTLSADTSRGSCCEGVASDSGRKKRAITAVSPFEKRKKKRRISPRTMALENTVECSSLTSSEGGGDLVASSRSGNHPRTAQKTNSMPTPEKERWSNLDKTVFDVSDASSTVSAKQRQMHFPKANGRSYIGTLWEDGSYWNEENVNNSDVDDPSSDDWIGEMTTSTAKSLERMAAVTKRKFDRQRRYYESQLQVQREENQELDDENARLRKELSKTKKS